MSVRCLKRCESSAVVFLSTIFMSFDLLFGSVWLVVMSMSQHDVESCGAMQADVEALMSGCSDKKLPERVEELNAFIKKHEEQTAKLEQVLRLVENEQASTTDRLVSLGDLWRI